MSDEIIENNGEAPVVETVVEAPKERAFDGLPNREALHESIKIHREGKDIAEVKAPTTTDVKEAVAEDINPPSGFSKEASEAWKRKDIPAIQKEYRRIYDARTIEITRAQTAESKFKAEAEKERAEATTWRDLGKMAAPYIEARGLEGVTPQAAMMEALALVNEFKKGDPSAVKAELKKIGIDLDKAPENRATASTIPDPKIEALQATVETLQKKEEQREAHRLIQTFDTVFAKMNSEKTRTGDPVFPDLLDTSEEGSKFAEELGSLTYDKRFQAGVVRRFPNADIETVIREAYKYLGGKVSGEAVKVSTKSNQEHIDKSRRATAAIPGRTAPINRSEIENLRGKLSNRAAYRKAREIHGEH